MVSDLYWAEEAVDRQPYVSENWARYHRINGMQKEDTPNAPVPPEPAVFDPGIEDFVAKLGEENLPATRSE